MLFQLLPTNALTKLDELLWRKNKISIIANWSSDMASNLDDKVSNLKRIPFGIDTVHISFGDHGQFLG